MVTYKGWRKQGGRSDSIFWICLLIFLTSDLYKNMFKITNQKKSLPRHQYTQEINFYSMSFRNWLVLMLKYFLKSIKNFCSIQRKLVFSRTLRSFSFWRHWITPAALLRIIKMGIIYIYMIYVKFPVWCRIRNRFQLMVAWVAPVA